MKAVIQRVKQASVEEGGEVIAEIGPGLHVFLGIESEDGAEDLEWLTGKIANMRVFGDGEEFLSKSCGDIDGEVLVVSQFTLAGSFKKGSRPSFSRSAKPDVAKELYDTFVEKLSAELGKPVKEGRFGAIMQVSLTNDGPITFILDSKNK